MSFMCMSTRYEVTKTMPSASGKPTRETLDVTRGAGAPLTEDELAEVRLSRVEARQKALDYANAMTDEEDARLTAAAESDPDNPPLTEKFWSRARPAHEVHPDWVRRSLERKRGRPKLDTPKQQVTLRIDADILDYFKSQGAGWQTAMNDTLRKGMRSL